MRGKVNLPDEKWCIRCSQSRPLATFGLRSSAEDRVQSWCKSCIREYGLLKTEKKRQARAALLAERLRVIEAQGKTCTQCKQVRPATEFKRDTKGDHLDGLRSECTHCTKAYMRRRYAINPAARAKQKESAQEWRLRNDYLPNLRLKRSRDRAELTEAYLKKLLTDRSELKVADLPKALLDLKREQLAVARLKREVKQAINKRKETENDPEQKHD